MAVDVWKFNVLCDVQNRELDHKLASHSIAGL